MKMLNRIDELFGILRFFNFQFVLDCVGLNQNKQYELSFENTDVFQKCDKAKSQFLTILVQISHLFAR